ncbi:hypothetical protein HYX10_01100 [Candidatus Woesearchaeota archaeon]|nr:hypothetical protein [Candidatus Woesearchaeota archaeon]
MLSFKRKPKAFYIYHYVILRNMVMITGTISKGSVMDQIYVPKIRAPGFERGVAVAITPLQGKAIAEIYRYHVQHLEPIKKIIVDEIFSYFEHVDNVLVAGSFLEEGFEFEDIDTVVLTEKSIGNAAIKKHFKAALGIDIHLICLPLRELLKGMDRDPLFQMLLSRFVAKKRLIMPKNMTKNYKLLDLQLLESKALIDSFDFLNGREKYKLVRNAVAIARFLDNRPLNASLVDNEIERHFGKASVIKIKENAVEAGFRSKYALFHRKLLKRILDGVENESK